VKFNRTLNRQANLYWKIKLIPACFSSLCHRVPPVMGCTLDAIVLIHRATETKPLNRRIPCNFDGRPGNFCLL
jgi:hypothetical protein